MFAADGQVRVSGDSGDKLEGISVGGGRSGLGEGEG